MGADKLQNFIIGFILFTLFAYLFLSFGINFGATYNKTFDDVGGGAYNITPFELYSQNVSDLAEPKQKSFWASKLLNIDAVSGIFTIAKSLWDLTMVPFELMSNILTNVLQVPIIITKVILAILTVVTIFYIWRFIKIGD
jgi:hypothetical protein